MPKYDPNEIPEIVGSRDLREVFDKQGAVRGGLFINNVEIQPFSASGISALLGALNAQADRTFVDASIDDGYHLVLEARSPGPIRIRAGGIYQEPPPAPGTTDSTAQAVAAAIKETKAKEGERPKNSILEDLGLEATDERSAVVSGAAHPSAGMSADERHKARHERAMAAGAIRGYPQRTDVHGNLPQKRVVDDRTNEERFNPTPSERRLPGQGVSKPGATRPPGPQ